MSTDVRKTLIAAATHFYQVGWMVGTAGNLSAKTPDGSFWITASGCNKGQLREEDFVRIAPTGTVVESYPNQRPSAEMSIHQAIYSLFPEAQACYHVHSIEANLVSHFTDSEELPLPALEMIKGLGVWEEDPQVSLPVFINHLHVPQIAKEISDRFSHSPPPVPALLIRNHGVTVWGSSPATTQNYLEVVEYLFRYLVAARQVGISN
ncbi:MAG: methylthioribulose 1-phosphate dehydratase [Kastovskya adunca ATA6-11-RM4]|jgi:methylthioribulose-1-phosphate dehydratase|nr:methylthioribulose 1-phosphate dehydratase [Kastovskya adunca ATA6-11-RM4]